MSKEYHEAKSWHINRYKMAHMIGVAEYMRERAGDYGLEPDVMYALGLLHDIGYLEGHKGHEAVGANILAAIGVNFEMVSAVANHAGNNLYDLAVDEITPSLVLLIEADMSVDARGYRVGFEGRVADIASRYGEDSAAHNQALDNIAFVKGWQTQHGIGKPVDLYHRRDKTMEYMGHELTDKFDYVCKAEDGAINEFTIFANVVGEKDGKVELDRFQRFGNLHLDPITMSSEKFKEFYERTEPVEAKREKNSVER